MSSHHWLYPIFRCRGYRVTKVQTDEQRLLLYVEPQPHKVCCPQCGSGTSSPAGRRSAGCGTWRWEATARG
jgi:hypothetical protein